MSVDVYEIASLQIGSTTVNKLRVLSYDIGAGPRADGVLGRDFLGKFTITVDSTAGRVTLGPKR